MRRHYDEREEYYDDEESGGLDIVDLIFALLRRWKVIVLVTIPIVIAGFLWLLQDQLFTDQRQLLWYQQEMDFLLMEVI